MSSAEQPEEVEPDLVIGLPYEVSAFIGDTAQRRLVSLDPGSIVEGQGGYVGIKLYKDESIPEDRKRLMWLPTNQIVVKPETYGESSFIDGRLIIHYEQSMITADGTKTELTGKEFSLLKHLVANKGVIQTKHQLLESIWGDAEFRTSSTVAVYVNRLRKKMGGLRWTLQTVRHWGYMFNDTLPLSSRAVDINQS